jgi:hypothetical protein
VIYVWHLNLGSSDDKSQQNNSYISRPARGNASTPNLLRGSKFINPSSGGAVMLSRGNQNV